MNIKNIVVCVAVLLMGTNIASALSVIQTGSPDGGSSSLLFGQEHFYSVLFRGNGEAVVYVRIVFTNTSDKPMSEFVFQAPRALITELVAFQQFSAPCIRVSGNESRCLEYDYYRFTDRSGYEKASAVESDGLYTINLPHPVEPNRTSAVIVAYAAQGYVSKGIGGLYRFEFETLKVPTRVQEVRIGVDVDTDLYLQGKRSSVNYSGTVWLAPMSISKDNESFSYMVDRIGNDGALVKTAKSLAPYESFEMTGVYSRSWFRLHLGSFITALLVVVLVIAGAYLRRKMIAGRVKIGKVTAQPEALGHQVGRERDGVAMRFNPFNPKLLIAGLISVVCVTLLTYGIVVLSRTGLLNGGGETIIQVFIVIAIGIAYIGAVSAPAAVMQAKHGIAAMWSVFAAEFLWLVMFIVLYIALFSQPYGYR